MNKAKGLFLDSSFTGEIKDIKIDSGNVIVDNSTEHIVDNTIPINMKGRFGSTPLYILKWDALIPINFERKSKIITAQEAQKMIEEEGFIRIDEETKDDEKKGKLRRWAAKKKKQQTNEYYTPTHYEYRKLNIIDITDKHETSKIQPALLQETMDMRFLKNMKQYAVGKSGTTDKNKIIIASIGSMVMGMVILYVLLAFGM